MLCDSCEMTTTAPSKERLPLRVTSGRTHLEQNEFASPSEADIAPRPTATFLGAGGRSQKWKATDAAVSFQSRGCDRVARSLLDNFIGARQQMGRHDQANRCRCS